MDFLTLAKKRYSLRKMSEQPIEQEKLDLILEASRIAPTAHNKQPQRIIVCNTTETLDKVRASTKSHFRSNCILLVCYDYDEAWVDEAGTKNEGHTDAAIVTTHMMLAATELGIGSTWVAAFDTAEIIKQFQLPENIKPVAILPLGYPHETAKPAHLHELRKDINETVAYNKLP